MKTLENLLIELSNNTRQFKINQQKENDRRKKEFEKEFLEKIQNTFFKWILSLNHSKIFKTETLTVYNRNHYLEIFYKCNLIAEVTINSSLSSVVFTFHQNNIISGLNKWITYFKINDLNDINKVNDAKYNFAKNLFNTIKEIDEERTGL